MGHHSPTSKPNGEAAGGAEIQVATGCSHALAAIESNPARATIAATAAHNMANRASCLASAKAEDAGEVLALIRCKTLSLLTGASAFLVRLAASASHLSMSTMADLLWSCSSLYTAAKQFPLGKYANLCQKLKRRCPWPPVALPEDCSTKYKTCKAWGHVPAFPSAWTTLRRNMFRRLIVLVRVCCLCWQSLDFAGAGVASRHCSTPAVSSEIGSAFTTTAGLNRG